MKFEKWMEIHVIRHSTGQDPDDEGLILADWKAEREQVEIALLATRQQRDNEFNRAEKLKLAREKLIGALAETTVMLKVLHGINNKPKCADVKCAYCLRADTNRAVLAEMKETRYEDRKRDYVGDGIGTNGPYGNGCDEDTYRPAAAGDRRSAERD